MTRSDAPLRALDVRHEPNPCAVHVSPVFPRSPLPFMWYYRTEVRNTTDRPLRVVWFECYARAWGRWRPANVLGRPLTAEDFTQWYTTGAADFDGTIPPGGGAVCEVNWHGGRCPWAPRRKWAYRAVDDDGREYDGEAELAFRPIRNGRAAAWLAGLLMVLAGIPLALWDRSATLSQVLGALITGAGLVIWYHEIYWDFAPAAVEAGEDEPGQTWRR